MAGYFNSDAPTRAARLFKIITLLAARRPTERLGLLQLAEACGCNPKTIQRDIQCLQSIQTPIEYDRLARSYTLPDKGWSYPLTTLTPADALALALAQGLLLNTAAPLPFAKEIARALEKATTGLTPQLRSLMMAAVRAIAEPGGTARDYSQAPMDILLEGIAHRRTMEMLYDSRSSGTCERRRMDPYRLDLRDGRYFELHAWCHKRQEVRTFALDRISEIMPTGETFVRREWNESEDGIVGGLRGGKPIPLRVLFDSVMAPFARARRWPFTAEFVEAEDGAVVMQGIVKGTDGIVKELLSWRRHAQVLGGPELRARMAEEVRAMAALYAED